MTATDDPRIRPTDPPWLAANIDRVYAFNPLPDSRARCRVPHCERPVHALGLCLSHRSMAARLFGPIREERLARKREYNRAVRQAAKEAGE